MTTVADRPGVQVLPRLDPGQVREVLAVVGAAEAADGVHPLSEHVSLHLRYGGDEAARSLLARVADGPVVGYAHLDPTDPVEGAAGEVVVDPDHRGQGTGRQLVETLLAESPGGRLRLWAHGAHPSAEALARRLGFERTRVLWQMRRSLADPLPEPRLPDGVGLRTFRVGADEAQWTRLNARAFADHPEQGQWTVAELALREQEPWFDPAGFFLAERDGRLVGFHWTKVHGGPAGPLAADGQPGPPGQPERSTGHGHEPIGEVYVVGVDRDHQGSGLGPALTLVGLHHLRDRGLDQAMLYVDEDNTPAIRVYERLGFRRFDTDVRYSRG